MERNDSFKGKTGLEIRGDTVTTILPPLRSWSRTPQNRCTFREILTHWKAHDAITFLVDRRIYHTSFTTFLTQGEKEQECIYKPLVSRQRFVVSRTILKHILREILSEEQVAEVVLIRNREGRILIRDHPSVFTSLAYSGTSIAITVGKRKLGSDIEGVRPVHDKKIISSPLFIEMKCKTEMEHTTRVIHVWTLLEAFAKFHDMNPYPLLKNNALFENTYFASYCIDQHSIFSLASGPGLLTDTLLWLDTSGMRKSS
jgi:4'-phosphopantetheinyl transferase